MRNKVLLTIKSLLVAVFLFTSCETDNQDTSPEARDNEFEITPDTKISGKASGAVNEKVYRYYRGGSQSLHTYQTQSGSGIAVGNYEGVAFVTPVTTSSAGIDRNKYNILYFLAHPQLQDFIMTTSATEFWNLRGRGWKNVTRRYVLIQKRSGSGTKKLYRFYNRTNSDHLYTTNYSEGVNAGYRYEGVTGWVY